MQPLGFPGWKGTARVERLVEEPGRAEVAGREPTDAEEDMTRWRATVGSRTGS